MNRSDRDHEHTADLQRFAMRLSLAIGFLMLAGKIFAYWLIGSVAILSDAAESVVYVAAVSFAAYSLSLSLKPPDRSHLYGHDKISFFSAGFEEAMIVIAAIYIIGNPGGSRTGPFSLTLQTAFRVTYTNYSNLQLSKWFIR